MATMAIPTNAQSKTVAIQSPARTPTHSPSKRPIMIFQGQKQALIDNLQLEVTERARKLRAQYALQCQSLRTRIGLRVNRIPTAMRKANMGELWVKHLESIKQPPAASAKRSSTELDTASKQQPPAKAAHTLSDSRPTIKNTAPPPPSRGNKRTSDHFAADDDKENTPDPTAPLSHKKRPKHNNVQSSNPSTVLSPKSSNIAHQSPARPQLGSPQKSYLSHPTSPLKPSAGFEAMKVASPAKAAAMVAAAASSSSTTANTNTEKPRATRTRGAATAKSTKTAATTKAKAPTAAVTRAKRGAEPVKEEGSRTVSAASNVSNATTVVRKAPATAGAKGKAKAAVGKKAAPAAAATKAEEPAQGRRVLRKRG
ncbi:MAG: hypothetical protein Q9174_001439 [Haloplaca sp. 1 TL-2023]